MNLVKRPSNHEPMFSRLGLDPLLLVGVATVSPAIRADNISASLVTAASTEVEALVWRANVSTALQ
jgi:hypothetical protein